MRITTWNINGLRSGVTQGFEKWLTESKNDIVCLQEVKMHGDLLTDAWFSPYETLWNMADRAGYSGVATLVNEHLKPVSVDRGIGIESLDSEGRVLTTEFSSFILINAYAPHSHRKLIRLEQKLQFCDGLLRHIEKIRQRNKPLIIVGDLNVAHQEIDLTNFAANRKNAGFLPEERQWMTSLLSDGFVDAFRMFYSDSGHYTWWSPIKGVRERNVGWRLDYILVDSALKDQVRACFHSPNQRGSDHCPVTIDIDI